jgi:hypothetical protein
MVGIVMARNHALQLLPLATAPAAAARALVHPGTLVFLGLTR